MAHLSGRSSSNRSGSQGEMGKGEEGEEVKMIFETELRFTPLTA
jgi:hypothetical protein